MIQGYEIIFIKAMSRLDNNFQRHISYAFQASLLSFMSQRNLVSITFSITCFFIRHVASHLYFSFWLKIIKWVFLTFRDNLSTFSQVKVRSSWLLNSDSNSFRSEPVKIRLISSAKELKFNNYNHFMNHFCIRKQKQTRNRALGCTMFNVFVSMKFHCMLRNGSCQ